MFDGLLGQLLNFTPELYKLIVGGQATALVGSDPQIWYRDETIKVLRVHWEILTSPAYSFRKP